VSCTEWKNLFSLEIYGRDGKIAIDGLGGSYGVERCTYYKMLPQMGPPETTVWEYPGGDDLLGAGNGGLSSTTSASAASRRPACAKASARWKSSSHLPEKRLPSLLTARL
jgi:hypothetical protein